MTHYLRFKPEQDDPSPGCWCAYCGVDIEGLPAAHQWATADWQYRCGRCRIPPKTEAQKQFLREEAPKRWRAEAESQGWQIR